MREANYRSGIFNAQQGNVKKTMVGVFPRDLAKKDFETISSGDIMETKMEGPHSDRDAAESSPLYDPMAWSQQEIKLILEMNLSLLATSTIKGPL
jgi:hypothetical protein